MAAVIGGTREDIFKLCAAFDIDAANFNCPGQVVISGDADKVAQAVARAKEFGPFKLVKPLVVAGAYHSRLMEPARQAFEAYLQGVEFKRPQVTVYSNTTGGTLAEPADLRAALVKQVVSSVLWEDDCKAAADRRRRPVLRMRPGRRPGRHDEAHRARGPRGFPARVRRYSRLNPVRRGLTLDKRPVRSPIKSFPSLPCP
jgi:[acyl-carrier-protein] S-malonyltransferase